MSYERYLALKCNKCGSSPDDWLDDDGRPLEEPVLEASIGICEGCGATDHAQQAGAKLRGAYVRLVPFGTASSDELDEEDEPA